MLLVSVRNAFEAQIALAVGVDIVDVKEPRAGSLGAAGIAAVGDVLRTVGDLRPVSVALGELAELPTKADGNLCDGRVAFAKIGLAKCAAWPGWIRELESAFSLLPDQTGRVAVVYADYEVAQSPRPAEVLEIGESLGCRAALLDTYDKRGPGLMRLWEAREIAQWIHSAKCAGMQAVVAGQLSMEDCRTVAAYGPDYVAVRGAVCWPDRCGEIDAGRITQLRNVVIQSACGARAASAVSKYPPKLMRQL
jgi:uncharacterized protein (UPF0264 family)